MKYYFLILVIVPLIGFSNPKPTGELEFECHENNLNSVENSKPVNHELWNALVSKYVSDEGNVDYNGLKKDELQLQKYLQTLKSNPPLDVWTKNEKLAYWINAYNAFTIQLILDNYPLKSILDIKDPWDIAFIDIADTTYSLGDIEHKILRKMNEPRIHFAINCASFSCPNLLNQAYKAEDLNAQLETAADRFVNDTSKNTIAKDGVEISKIFEWFGDDFKSYGSIVDFLNVYSNIKIDNNATVTYKDYNWSLNK